MARLCALLSKEFSAPSSPVEGLAGYSLEQGAKRLYPKPVGAVLRGKAGKKLTSLITMLAKKAKDPYQEFAEWLLAEIDKAVKEGKKAKKADLGLLKGDLPGHEFHGNQWTGGLGAKPTETKSKEKSVALKELIASGHKWSPAEIVKITGASSTYVNKTLKALEGKEHNGLALVKDGKYYQVKPVGEAKVEAPMTVGAKAGAVDEGKVSEAKPTAAETHKAIPPASPMPKEMADKIYAGELQNAHDALTAAMNAGVSPEKAVLAWKNDKALGMAQWKANTTGNGFQAKPQEVFKSDLKFAEAMKNATSEAQQKAAYEQWKKDTAAEKSGAAVQIKDNQAKTVQQMDAKVEQELPSIHSSIVPASHVAIGKGDFEQSTGNKYGKWSKGMASVKKLLETESKGSVGNKQEIEKRLGARLSQAPNFTKVAEMYSKFKTSSSSAVGTLQAALISKWAGTSADSDNLAQAMQMAIRDVFGMDHSDVNNVGNSKLPATKAESDGLYHKAGSALLGSGYNPDKHGPLVQAALKDFVKAQYSNTQEYLKESGVKELYLARGMKVGSGAHKAEKVSLKLQPASSFSVNLGTAKAFAGGHTLYLVKVPASQVLGTYRTGYGCSNEHEVVVLADKNTVAVKVGANRAGGSLAGAATAVKEDLS